MVPLDVKREAFVGFGTNLCEPIGILRRAVALLLADEEILGVRCSPLYRTLPLGPIPQADFTNGVIALSTRHAPERLLDRLLEVETALGRVRTRRWGPRTLDLDLLLFGSSVCDTPRLTLPHPGMPARGFVLAPLTDLAPDARHPILGATAKELFDLWRQKTPRAGIDVRRMFSVRCSTDGW